MKKQLRGILRITYLFTKCHKHVIEKMLHPDSIYVTEILKNDYRTKIWTEIIKIYPKYTEYQKLSKRIIPLIKLNKI